MVNFLLYSILCHNPVNRHVSPLADPQGPLGGLQVNHRVPVGVHDYHLVCGGQVDPQTPHPSRQQEHGQASLLILVLERAELRDERHSLLDVDVTVEPDKGDLFLVKHVLYNVENFFSLAEQEQLVRVSVEVVQKLTQNCKFARKLDLIVCESAFIRVSLLYRLL